MNTLDTPFSGDLNTHGFFSEGSTNNSEIARSANYFKCDPKAKFVLSLSGSLLQANIKAMEFLDAGIITRLPDYKLSYGSPETNNCVEDILEQFRQKRISSNKLLRRHEEGWIIFEFSSSEFMSETEILLTVFTPVNSEAYSLDAISKAFGFTITEAKVAEYMAMAYCPKEISQELDITTNTVRAHLRSIYSKTGVRGYNRAMHLILKLLV